MTIFTSSLGMPACSSAAYFQDRVVFAVAAIGEQRFKRIAPMICNAPLHLITDRADGEVGRSVDQAHAYPAALPGALRADVDQFLRDRRAGAICMALRNHREILRHRGLDAAPFFRQLARSDRLGFHAEQLSGLFIAAGAGGTDAAFVPSSTNETASSSLAAKKAKAGAGSIRSPACASVQTAPASKKDLHLRRRENRQETPAVAHRGLI